MNYCGYHFSSCQVELHVVGSPGMEGAGDTLDHLKDEPKDALALLAVKGRLDQLHRLYSRRSSTALVHTEEEVYPTKTRLYWRQPTLILTRIGLY